MVARRCEYLTSLKYENEAMQAFYYIMMEERQCEQNLSPLTNSTA